MVFDGKPVGLVLDPGDQLKALAVPVNGDLHILVIEAPGPVVIVLDHATDRDGEPQTLQDLQGHVYLAPSAVHHDQIREACEAPEPFHISRIPVRRLHGHKLFPL